MISKTFDITWKGHKPRRVYFSNVDLMPDMLYDHRMFVGYLIGTSYVSGGSPHQYMLTRPNSFFFGYVGDGKWAGSVDGGDFTAKDVELNSMLTKADGHGELDAPPEAL